MAKVKIAFVGVLVFMLSVIGAFYFNSDYKKIIRRLYIILSDNKISFHTPTKYLDFPTWLFVLSFGISIVIILALIYSQPTKQKIAKLAYSIILFTGSTLVFCYIDGFRKILECTLCDEGTRKLSYRDINYDICFIQSLFFSLLPLVILEIRRIFAFDRKHL